jgi:hypothetical protein
MKLVVNNIRAKKFSITDISEETASASGNNELRNIIIADYPDNTDKYLAE